MREPTDTTGEAHPAPPAGARGDEAGARRRGLLLLLGAAVLAAFAGVALLVAARHRREEAERARLAEVARRGPNVLVARARTGAGTRTVLLPGDVRPLWQSTLYAKVSGYVTAIPVDKGDRVRRGQILARISSPETDDQVRSAEATLALRERSWARVHRLAPTGYVSQADIDQADTDLRAARADTQRVRSLQSYEVLRAPFDGLVTTRYVDPGALLTASSTGAPVVDLADPRRVTVYVYVGQDVAAWVKPGDAAEVTLDARPGERIAAHVARTSGAIDPRTRAMLVQLDVGEGAQLVPGLFVHVALRVNEPALPSIPADALVSRGDRLQVATVADGRLHFLDVVPGDTDGRQLQIREGLKGDELVALSPPSELGEGTPVQPVTHGAGEAPEARRASR
jgi:RND family efflux transporter MFP subunit